MEVYYLVEYLKPIKQQTEREIQTFGKETPISSYWYHADINEVISILQLSPKKVQICFTDLNHSTSHSDARESRARIASDYKIKNLYNNIHDFLFIINHDKNEVAPFTIDNFHVLLTTLWKDNTISICDSDERPMLIDIQDDFVMM
jgi:hypothetical protein